VRSAITRSLKLFHAHRPCRRCAGKRRSPSGVTNFFFFLGGGLCRPFISGAGTNLKVKAQSDEQNVVVPPPLFLSLRVQLVVLVSAFVMVSTVWPVSCLLFFYSRCPRDQTCKTGVTCPPPPVPYGVGTGAVPFMTYKLKITAFSPQSYRQAMVTATSQTTHGF